MSFILKYSSKAEAEYFKAFDYYEDQLDGLGDRFEQAVANKVGQIVKNPYQYQGKRSNYRECWVKEFPFLIVYKVLAVNRVILITSIFHTSRNPKRKYRK
ncbi:MAG: type II toxin-antitoxin system RelE/ParE family toxin [Sphingobacteriales bacterium]